MRKSVAETIDKFRQKKRVAVDLDGVLVSYDEWEGKEEFGEPLPGAREFLEELGKKYIVCIWTARCTVTEEDQTPESLKRLVQDHLNKHDLPYDEIWTEQGKPIAIAYIDDNAIQCRPQEDGPEIYEKVLETLEARKK